MRLRAVRLGFDGMCRRREGDEFDWPDDRKVPSWAEQVEGGAEPGETPARAAHAETVRRSRPPKGTEAVN